VIHTALRDIYLADTKPGITEREPSTRQATPSEIQAAYRTKLYEPKGYLINNGPTTKCGKCKKRFFLRALKWNLCFVCREEIVTFE
jgi:hypothetical protein